MMILKNFYVIICGNTETSMTGNHIAYQAQIW